MNISVNIINSNNNDDNDNTLLDFLKTFHYLFIQIDCMLFQVNGINVEWDNYSRVADMIRAGGKKLDLLVVDDDSDQFLDHEDITLSKDQRFVDVIVCPDEVDINANGLYI